ncbi:unnamed protein product [Heligmosomoides polygyrus]|uniref:Reverse transcriptase domain-containing protein n=1 Tax=Heligmosomoides polygyrus TaxID=6339 RepID=A0A183FIK0_HELPZ|nr:unnamed protein product [Heligmosomoides polygyrus]
MDRIRNDAIRQKFGVAPIADKMREARLRWYGHVLRGEEDSVRKIGLKFEVVGKRPRGRPKQRWSDTLHMDLKVAGVHPDLALDRERAAEENRREAPNSRGKIVVKMVSVETQKRPSPGSLTASSIKTVQVNLKIQRKEEEEEEKKKKKHSGIPPIAEIGMHGASDE